MLLTFNALQNSEGRQSAVCIRPALLSHPGFLEAVLPKLSPIQWDYVWSVNRADDVDVLLAKTL